MGKESSTGAQLQARTQECSQHGHLLLTALALHVFGAQLVHAALWSLHAEQQIKLVSKPSAMYARWAAHLLRCRADLKMRGQ